MKNAIIQTLLAVVVLSLLPFVSNAEPDRLPCDNPVANPDAVVVSGNARFTVLTSRLVRMEWAADGHFEDNATFGVVNRRLDVPHFKVRKSRNRTVIETEDLKLVYFGKGKFDTSNLSVTFNMVQGDSAYRIVWRPGMNEGGNLLGTCRTLDSCDGEKTIDPFDKGVVSRDGWAVIDESERHILNPVDSDWKSWVAQRGDGERQDWYIFAYGHDYKAAVSDFTKISGKVPLPPKWAFGYWWSRYWQYSDFEIAGLCREIRSYGIPIDVMIIDMDWHEVFSLKLGGCLKDDFGESIGWTGYTWQKQLFPSPENCLSELHGLGVKTALNLHFNEGIQPFEEPYGRFVKDYLSRTSEYDGPQGYVYGMEPYHYAGVKKPAGEGKAGQPAPVPHRMSQIEWADAYFNSIIHPIEKQGVDFWWQDWQQWKYSRYVPGLSNTFWLNWCFFNDKVRRTEHLGIQAPRPMIYHRWGGIGSHRYPVGFSGDTYATWKVLGYLPYFTATASNVAYGYWGHDIGGFKKYEGMKSTNPELYTRWFQYGVFTPIFKTHSTKDPVIEKHFWKFSDHFPAMRDAIRLRYSLSPYIYTSAREAFDTGISICRPLYYDHPEVPEAYSFTQEYMFGDDILATVVCEPTDSVTGLAPRTIWFPEGSDWFDVASGRMFCGGVTETLRYTINENPWFVRAGAIIPMASEKITSLQGTDNTLRLLVAPGYGSSTTKVYEDDGQTQAYVSEYATTTISKRSDARSTHIEVTPRTGRFASAAQSRRVIIELANSYAPSEVLFNGVPVRYSRFAGQDFSGNEAPSEALWTYDGANLTMKIYLPESDISECLTVDCRFPEFSPEKIALLDGAKGRIGRMRKFAPEAKMAFGTYVDRICKMPDSFLAILQCGSFITEDPHGAPDYLSEFDPSAALDDLESIGKLPPDFIVRLRAQLVGE